MQAAKAFDEQDFAKDNVQIGANCRIFPGTKIGRKSIIGDNCIIGHYAKQDLQGADFSAVSPRTRKFLVGSQFAEIGEESIIRSGTVLYRHLKAGMKLRTGHNVIIREHTSIGNGCVVGTQAIIDGYVKIGDSSLIQSQCYLAQTVEIGKGVFVAPACVFLDNKNIVLGEGLNGPIVKDYVRLGGGCKILPSITIGESALIGAGSVVSRDIPEKAIAIGSPAKVERYQTNSEVEKYRLSIANWQ